MERAAIAEVRIAFQGKPNINDTASIFTYSEIIDC